jgi:hypothetical protein
MPADGKLEPVVRVDAAEANASTGSANTDLSSMEQAAETTASRAAARPAAAGGVHLG